MSFSSVSIENNLSILKEQYDIAMGSPQIDDSLKAALFSKFALLEFCGWIEETIDTILLDYIDRTIPTDTMKKTIRDEIVYRVYGFRYGNEFRPLMEKIIGARNFQHIVSQLSEMGSKEIMLQEMFAEFSAKRNKAAHTHWQQGVTPQFDAPSKIIDSFNQLKPVLRSIENMINGMN